MLVLMEKLFLPKVESRPALADARCGDGHERARRDDVNDVTYG